MNVDVLFLVVYQSKVAVLLAMLSKSFASFESQFAWFLYCEEVFLS